MIRCPNCGSTAQVGWVWGDNDVYQETHQNDYVCGCGCKFTITFNATNIEITEKGENI